MVVLGQVYAKGIGAGCACLRDEPFCRARTKAGALLALVVAPV
jgi:hypothetical protein